MPESAGEKTEKATPKKREDERKEGNIFQSKEIVIAVTLIATFFGFSLLYPLTESALSDFMTTYLVKIGETTSVTAGDSTQMLIGAIKCVAICAGPILLISAVSAILVTVAQTKGLVNFKSLRPKFNRMNPISGLKKLFSLSGFIELLKSLIKIAILFIVIYNTISDNMNVFPKMMDMSVGECAEKIGNLCFDLVKNVAIAFMFLAGFDFMYQKWNYEKKLRMTKQEVKEEYKNIEGDPQIKNKIKQKQQQMSRQRMIQAVPTADVIIRNPTHFAVALKYDKEKSKAPVVIAKGQDELALRIIAVGQENHIMITENRPLARALYAQVELDREIPAEFYQAVAEILAVLYKMRQENTKI